MKGTPNSAHQTSDDILAFLAAAQYMLKLSKTGVAVEKLVFAKFAKIKLRQDALQTTFSGFLDIFYPQIFAV